MHGHLCVTERKGGKGMENKQYVRTSIKMDKEADKINKTDRPTSKQSNNGEDIQAPSYMHLNL